MFYGRKTKTAELAEKFRDELLAKRLPKGSPVLSERELAEHFAISPVTARRILKVLVEQDILYRKPQSGTFIKHDPPVIPVIAYAGPLPDPENTDPLVYDASFRLLKHFSERRKPIYLFDASEAARIKDDGLLEDARKVMDHDIFGHKFNGPIDWMFNPTTETSRDNEWSWSLFRTIYWQPLARAYALTKDEKYTKEFLSELHSFREAWPADEFIKDTTFVPKQPFPGTAWRTIETGIRVYTTWLPVFEIFRSSPVWTMEDLAAYLMGLRDHALFLMGHYSNHDRSSNWLSMETSALLQIAVMFPEFSESDEWFHTAYGRVMHEVRYCFSDNGVHMEKTPIYHMVASIAFAQALVLCEKNGIYVPDYAWEVIRRSALYICSLFKPDLSTPMIGDADRDDLTTRRADTSIYEGMNLSFFPKDLNELRAYMNWMYDLFGDEQFRFFGTLRKEGTEPDSLDFKYSEEGVYVMRTGWGDNADYLCTHSTQLERGERSTHSHNDSMHAEVTLRGEDVLVDCGRYIYRSSIWKDWRAYFVSALAHNTLYVDDHAALLVEKLMFLRPV